MQRALERGNAAVLSEVLSIWRPRLNQGDEEGQTPLMRAARAAWEDGLRLLLDAGADPTLLDRRKRNLLHHAAMAGSVDCLRLGLDRLPLSHRFQRDSNNENAIHIAARVGAVEALRLLIRSDLSFHFLNEYDQTPLDVAVAAGQDDVIAVLVAEGAQATVASTLREALLAKGSRRLALLQQAIEFQEVESCERIELKRGPRVSTFRSPEIALRLLALESRTLDKEVALALRQETLELWPDDPRGLVILDEQILEGGMSWRKLRVDRSDLEGWEFGGRFEVTEISSQGTGPKIGILSPL